MQCLRLHTRLLLMLKKYDPFLIPNEQDLFAFTLLAQNYESIRPIDTLHFKQTADIEWSGKYDWFIDSLKNIYYDGGDHVISGLKINRPDQDTVGFARVLGKVVISHLTFKNFEVNGRSFVGMLAGINGYGVIHNMSLYGTVQGDSIVGGVCGKSEWTTTNILSFVDVFGKNMVGGMFGLGFGYLINSASFGNVKGDSLVGGISGRVTTSYSSLYKNVYAVNDVDARTHGGVFVYNPREVDALLESVDCGTIWGIGPARARKLQLHGIKNALMLKHIPLCDANRSEKISPIMTADMIAGRKSVTLKKAIPFSFLLRRTARRRASGISTASFPAERITVLRRDCQKSGSLLNALTKLARPVKSQSPNPL